MVRSAKVDAALMKGNFGSRSKGVTTGIINPIPSMSIRVVKKMTLRRVLLLFI